MNSSQNKPINSDRSFLIGLMIGSYLLSFVISFIGSFPIGFPTPTLSIYLEATFTILAIYSAIASVWIFYHDMKHTAHIRIFMIISFLLITGTSFLLISANFFLFISPYLRATAILLIGTTPMITYITLRNTFSDSPSIIRDVQRYILCTAFFILIWSIHAAFMPFGLPNLFEIGLLSIKSIIYNFVALIGLYLAIQLTRFERNKVKLLVLPSIAYIVIGIVIGSYFQIYKFNSFRIFEMAISEPWRWAISYDMPLFSKTYNYIFYLVFPAMALPLGWKLLKRGNKSQDMPWLNILYGWFILFISGAGSTDTFEIIGKLIGYSLLVIGNIELLTIHKSQSSLQTNIIT